MSSDWNGPGAPTGSVPRAPWLPQERVLPRGGLELPGWLPRPPERLQVRGTGHHPPAHPQSPGQRCPGLWACPTETAAAGPSAPTTRPSPPPAGSTHSQPSVPRSRLLIPRSTPTLGKSTPWLGPQGPGPRQSRGPHRPQAPHLLGEAATPIPVPPRPPPPPPQQDVWVLCLVGDRLCLKPRAGGGGRWGQALGLQEGGDGDRPRAAGRGRQGQALGLREGETGRGPDYRRGEVLTQAASMYPASPPQWSLPPMLEMLL